MDAIAEQLARIADQQAETNRLLQVIACGVEQAFINGEIGISLNGIENAVKCGR